MHHVRALAVPVLAAVLTAACTPAAPPPAAPTAGSYAAIGVTEPGFRLPPGEGCAGEVARLRAVIDNDLATGNVGGGVHRQMAAETTRAEAACAAGRGAEASRIVAATKARHGYP